MALGRGNCQRSFVASQSLPERKVSATEYWSVRGCGHFRVSSKRTSKSSAIYVTLQLSSVPDAHNVKSSLPAPDLVVGVGLVMSGGIWTTFPSLLQED